MVRRAVHRVASALVLASALALATAPAAPAGEGCGAAAPAWDAPGPFAVTVEPSGQGHTIFRPATLPAPGCARHPVILWGNGTGVAPAAYQGLLRHLAAHGFIVAAADTPQPASGREMLAGLDWLAAESSRAGSAYAGAVDLGHVGAAGHSQGGGAAIVVGADPRVGTVVALQPGPFGAIGALHGPVLLLGGARDVIVPPPLLLAPRFAEAEHVPAVFGVLAGATHLTPTGDGGGYRGPVTAWLRLHLMGDERARTELLGPACRPCASPAWTRWERNARALGLATTPAAAGPAPAGPPRLTRRCARGRLVVALTGDVAAVTAVRFAVGRVAHRRARAPWRATFTPRELPRGAARVRAAVGTPGATLALRRAAVRC